ncbi:hypothetical protein ACFX11_020021 [Malus domestica]
MPGCKIGDVNNRGSVLLKELNRGELIELQLPRRSDYESRCRIHIGDEQGKRQNCRSANNKERFDNRGEQVFGGEQKLVEARRAERLVQRDQRFAGGSKLLKRKRFGYF